MPQRIIAVTVALDVLAAATPAGPVLTSGVGTPVSDPALSAETAIMFEATTAGASGSLAIGNATFIGVDAPINIGADFNGSFNTSGGQTLFSGSDLVPA